MFNYTANYDPKRMFPVFQFAASSEEIVEGLKRLDKFIEEYEANKKAKEHDKEDESQA